MRKFAQWPTKNTGSRLQKAIGFTNPPGGITVA